MAKRAARPVLASAFMAAGIILAAAAPAAAQSRDAAALMNRVQQLEQQVRALEGRAGGGGGPAAARLEVRQSQQEADLRALTGRVEELGYQVSRLGERLDKLTADMEYRLAQGAAAGGGTAGGGTADPASPPLMPLPGPAAGPAAEAAPAPAPAARPAPDEIYPERQPRPLGSMPAGEAGAAPAPRPPAAAGGGPASAAQTPKERYAQAYDLLRQGKYDQAEAGFSAFLAQNPQDPLAENARYWLGETYYARGNYARAAEVFVEGYQASKTGPKAPDTLLKLGMSLSSMGKKKEACATFKELSRAFPQAPAAVKEKAAQEGRRAGCS
ncbi:MAG: tol-pal system protein YbgF [Rhodospirillales bacterium]|nr:tol-pal system protein YbgF [Rhodospirillales bacterium]